jgi:3-deoxy-7-phosphoheptulonate synthase
LTDFGLDNYLKLEAKQQPNWADAEVLEQVKKDLSVQPPLVFAGEVDTLRERLAQAARGEAFLLQGGDCAETFVDATADRIRNRIKTVLQMAVVLMYGSSLPVIKMGRMAGQFAKPRSSDFETRDGVTLPAYRGDAVNGYEFTEESRTNDARRLMQAYHTSSSTLNLIRAFTTGGFADLRQVHAWNKGFTDNPANKQYESIAGDIDRAMRFMEACGVDSAELRATEFFVSHEGLLFDSERPMT